LSAGLPRVTVEGPSRGGEAQEEIGMDDEDEGEENEGYDEDEVDGDYDVDMEQEDEEFDEEEDYDFDDGDNEPYPAAAAFCSNSPRELSAPSTGTLPPFALLCQPVSEAVKNQFRVPPAPASGGHAGAYWDSAATSLGWGKRA